MCPTSAPLCHCLCLCCHCHCLCHCCCVRRYLGDLRAARECFQASTRLRPDYPDAANWLVRVEAKLQGEVFVAASGPGAEATPTPMK